MITQLTSTGCRFNGSNFVHWTRMTEAQEDAWREALEARQQPRRRKQNRRSNSRRTGRNYNHRQPTAAESLARITARATAELVDRVNRRKASAPAAPADDIPFMGEPCELPEAVNESDTYF